MCRHGNRRHDAHQSHDDRLPARLTEPLQIVLTQALWVFLSPLRFSDFRHWNCTLSDRAWRRPPSFEGAYLSNFFVSISCRTHAWSRFRSWDKGRLDVRRAVLLVVAEWLRYTLYSVSCRDTQGRERLSLTRRNGRAGHWPRRWEISLCCWQKAFGICGRVDPIHACAGTPGSVDSRPLSC